MFEQTRFLGASVTSAGSSIAWNGEGSSQLKVSLVEDINNGDSFNPPIVGSPVTFELGSFKFRGLLQSYTENNSISGNPIYDVVVIDAADVLSGAEVIVNNYNGITNQVSNLINVFGYWESVLGFGGSGSNDGGMPWWLIRSGLEAIINNEAAPGFGGPLKFRGHSYKIDLSEMPVPPVYYRLGGNGSISLLQIISSLCADAGHDFFLTLSDDNIIKVRTVSRVEQPALNRIQTYINSITENVNTNFKGRELRNEVSSSFLVGGPVERLYQIINDGQSIWPFWGFDDNGNVLNGTGLGNNHTVNLNAGEVADIIGTTRYEVNVKELRCALQDENSWQTYIRVNKPELAERLNLVSGLDFKQINDALEGGNIAGLQDAIPNSKKSTEAIAKQNESDHINNIGRLYEFVGTYAKEYYGKKWLVRIPFVTRKIESETLEITYSEEPTNSGFLAENATPLGLENRLDSIIFKDQNGKFEAFVRFHSVQDADLSQLNFGVDALLINNFVYLRCNVDPQVYFVDGVPAVVVNLQNAIYKKPATPLGDTDFTIVNDILAGIIDIDKFKKLNQAHYMPFRVFPEAIGPDAAAIPLKNNRAVYGPWYVAGPDGKVNFQSDDSLVPWNYGGYGGMHLAGLGQVISSVTTQQEAETGQLRLAGTPDRSLGDALIAGGPIITNISLEYSTSGVLTTYTMQTYTHRFGLFAKSMIERLRRFSIAQQNQRAQLRRALDRILNRQATIARLRSFQDRLKEVYARTPHTCLHAFVDENDDGDKFRLSVSSMTDEEARAKSNAGYEDWFHTRTAYVSADGIYRPFSTQREDYEGLMPHLEEPKEGFEEDGISSDLIDPFASGNDISVYALGEEYDGWSMYAKDGPDGKDVTGGARPLALRGPLLISGWGVDLSTQEITPSGEGDSDHLRDFKNWKAGPVDLCWDDIRKVWTGNNLVSGRFRKGDDHDWILLEKPDGSFAETDSEGAFPVEHFLSSSNIQDDTKIIAGWFPVVKKWYVMIEDC